MEGPDILLFTVNSLDTLPSFKLPPSIKRSLLAIGPLKLNKRHGRLENHLRVFSNCDPEIHAKMSSIIVNQYS